MVINGNALLSASPIRDMLTNKQTEHGVSYGLTEVGYDIRLKQEVRFERPTKTSRMMCYLANIRQGHRFLIASAMEEFDMPNNLVAIVHDKSTWARKGLSVFNTVIEPGWRGFLTLELVYHGWEDLVIPAGSGIAQVIFHQLSDYGAYTGKYQDQEDKPVQARFR